MGKRLLLVLRLVPLLCVLLGVVLLLVWLEARYGAWAAGVLAVAVLGFITLAIHLMRGPQP